MHKEYGFVCCQILVGFGWHETFSKLCLLASACLLSKIKSNQKVNKNKKHFVIRQVIHESNFIPVKTCLSLVSVGANRLKLVEAMFVGDELFPLSQFELFVDLLSLVNDLWYFCSSSCKIVFSVLC